MVTLTPNDATVSYATLHNWRIIPNSAKRKDARLLVLSHGFGTDHRSWRLLLPDLLKHYDIAVYDLAGAGPNRVDNFDPDRHTSTSSYADDLLALIDEQGVTRCDILTHSVSGMVALIAAQKRPDLFTRIFMIAPSPRYLNDDDYFGGFQPVDLSGLFAAMEGSYKSWANGFAPVIVGDEFPDFVLEFAAGLLEMPMPVALQTAKFIFESDYRSILPDISVPTVVIQPRNDLAVPVAVGEYLQAHLPHAELHIIESHGHLPHLTVPQQVLHCLRPYLENK